MFKILLVLLTMTSLAFAEEKPLRTIEAVRALSHEEAAKGLQAVIEGTALFLDSKRPGFIIHDGTSSCWCAIKLPFPDNLKLGSRVRVIGQTNIELSYFANIVQAKTEVLGQGPLPEPRHVTRQDLFSPWIDAQWVEIEAIVVGTEEGGFSYTLVLDIDGKTFKADLPFQADNARRATALMQRRVILRGISGTVVNQNKQMTDRHFLIPSFDQIMPIETNLKEDSAPLKKINALLQSDNSQEDISKVEGIVTQHRSGGFYLRDETASTFVHATANAVYPPGSHVEVEGFATVAAFRPILRAVKIRIMDQAQIPSAIPLNTDLGIQPKLHNELVTLNCEFLAMRVGGQENILQCRSGNTYFEAWIPTPTADPIPLEPRDLIQITGIYEATTTHPMPRMEWADGFRVHLAGADAVTVLRKAPWWTLERLLLALGIAMAAILAFLIWTSLLRRRVAAQTQIITRQVEREVVKDERQRIARELHDTLEQDLTGLSMQLENATEEIGEANGPAYRSLTLVHRMLQHCRLEARASVSDLRNPDVLVRHLPEAMRESLNEKIRETNATLDFSVEGSPQPLRSTTQNHLLRIAREALTNALRHGKASHVRCNLSYAVDGVTLEVEDNGHGFDSTQPPPVGHFGLTGMRERANKIQSQFFLSSNPDTGTKIRVYLPYSSPEALPIERKFP